VANSAVLPLNALADVTLPRSHLLGPFVFELLSFKPRPSECHRPWEATWSGSLNDCRTDRTGDERVGTGTVEGRRDR